MLSAMCRRRDLSTVSSIAGDQKVSCHHQQGPWHCGEVPFSRHFFSFAFG